MKNILVQYKGGGYDGCFWEWNFALFDSNGKFHNLFSSGVLGVKTAEEAQEKASDDDSFVYDLTKKESIKEFLLENADANAKNIAEKINEIYDNSFILITCEECGLDVKPADIYHTGYKGNGGIGVVQLGRVCSDCFSLGSCFGCGEYVGQDEMACSADSLAKELDVNADALLIEWIEKLHNQGDYCLSCAKQQYLKEQKNKNSI
jgi:hypothetical protein